MNKSTSARIKIVATLLVFAAIALQLWQLFTPLPASLISLAKITFVILIIHAIEGLIAAALILKYKLDPVEKAPNEASALLVDHLPKETLPAVIKAGLYVFFVGTIGLKEVLKGTKVEPIAN